MWKEKNVKYVLEDSRQNGYDNQSKPFHLVLGKLVHAIHDRERERRSVSCHKKWQDTK